MVGPRAGASLRSPHSAMRPSKRPSPEESHSRPACRLSPTALAPLWILLALTLACSSTDAGVAGDSPGRDAVATGAAPAAPARAAAVNAAGSAAASGATRGAAGGDAPDSLLATPKVYAGWRSFNVNCQSCHGFNAVGSDLAPDLRNSVGAGGSITRASFGDVVREGRMARGMPAWAALLDDDKIEEIYAYLLARSSGSLGAGQPHLASN